MVYILQRTRLTWTTSHISCTYIATLHLSHPLLRVCSVSGIYGDTVRTIFTQPQYVPVARREIKTVEININNELGKPMPFVFGKSVVTLHFRRRHSLLPSSWGNRTAASRVSTCLISIILFNRRGGDFPVYVGRYRQRVMDWVIYSVVYFVEYYHTWKHLLRSHWELRLMLWRMFRKEKLGRILRCIEFQTISKVAFGNMNQTGSGIRRKRWSKSRIKIRSRSVTYFRNGQKACRRKAT